MSNISHFELQSTFIQSPLNYTGSKFKLLSQILPLFKKDIKCFVDLFCGGANVGINVRAEKIILNDKQKELIEIFKYFQKQKDEIIFKEIQKIIDDFKLSKSDQFGYEFYHCDSSKGLSSYNQRGFLKLRKAYNRDKDIVKLFVLIVFAFNNQLRFNAKNEFNLPCGKRDFNSKMQEKLRLFLRALKHKNIEFFNKDFKDFEINILDKKSFVYIDPPYFLGEASYNNAWRENEELSLLEFIQKLDLKGVKFALSNVLLHKNKEHILLKAWLKKNPKFKTYFLNFSYKNCNYQVKSSLTQEVLITNY